MNQYVIYRVKDTEIGKKLKHIPSICRNGRGTELQYDRWKNQQSATEKGESRSTKEEEICPFAFV